MHHCRHPGDDESGLQRPEAAIATVATSGTFIAAVVPAVNPATGVPDPLIAKTGTWKVVTEKQSVAKSGQLSRLQRAAMTTKLTERMRKVLRQVAIRN